MMLRLENNQPAQPRQFEVRLPYAPPQGVGLGDVVARMTKAMGMSAASCQPCQRRQQQLNNWMRFTRAW